MTRQDNLLAEALLDRFGDRLSRHTVEQLFEWGLADRKVCERIAIHGEMERLAQTGVRRVDALEIVAHKYGCSYEKVRGIFYAKH